MTLLDFPRPLEGSSRGRWRSASTDESLADESAWVWGFRVAVVWELRIVLANQWRSAPELYAQRTTSHRVKIPTTISGRRGEHSWEAKSRAKRRGALAWCMVLRAV